jgi:hypothetical protein
MCSICAKADSDISSKANANQVKDLPHRVVRPNGRGYFQPPRDVRAFIDPEACGPDGRRARARAKREVERKRREIKRARRARKQVGTGTFLDVGTFARDYLANVGMLSERYAASVSEPVPRFAPRGPSIPAGAIMRGADAD